MKLNDQYRIQRRTAWSLLLAAWAGGGLSSGGGVSDAAFAEETSSVVRAGRTIPITRSPIISRVFRLPPVDKNVQRVVVTAIAIDPQGEFLAVAGDDHMIRILHSETLRVVQVLGEGGAKKTSRPGHFDWIRTLAFDDAGARLMSAGNDGQLILWDRRRDFAVMQEIDSAPALACVRFSKSGKQIAAVGFDSQVFLIGRTTTSAPKLHCDCVDLRCCAYRDDGRVLAVAGRDGHLHLFDPEIGETVFEEELHSARIRDMAFMPDSGVLVSVSEDGEMIRFDTETRAMLSRQKITSGRLFALAVVDDRTVAAAGSEDGIHLVQVGEDNRSLRTQAVLTGHVGSVSTLGVCNGVLVSGGYDATLRRWDLPRLMAPESKIALGNDADKQTLSQTPR